VSTPPRHPGARREGTACGSRRSPRARARQALAAGGTRGARDLRAVQAAC